jgi:hypothetical protein
MNMKTIKLLTALASLFFIFNSSAQSLFVPGGFTSSGIGTSTVAGSVGIGTSSPAAYLHVVSPNGSTTPLFEATEAGTTLGDFFKIYNGTANTATFSPTLWGHNAYNYQGNTLLPALGMVASTPSSCDVASNTMPLCLISARQYNSGTYANIANRNLFQIWNLSTPVFTVGPTGNTTVNGPFLSNGGILSESYVNSSGPMWSGSTITGVGGGIFNAQVTIGYPSGTTLPSGMLLGVNGGVAIGLASTTKINTGTTKYNLAVGGGIITDAVTVQLQSNWADYVFGQDYKLMSLSEVKAYIEKNKHLPEVPAATEINEKGVEAGEMLNIHMKKIEELTLYMIQLKEENEALKKRIEAIEQK